MAWIVISEADLLTRVSGAELEALRTAALGDGQADPVAELFTQITDEIHGYLPPSLAGAANAVPSRLLGAALDRIIWELMKRPGATIIDDANGSRAKANAAATALFQRVAEGKFLVENPDTGASASPTGSQTINPPRQHESFNGL
jgi:hypothetical protein